MNGKLQPLLLAGAVNLQAWRALRNRRNERLSGLFPSPSLPMTIIKWKPNMALFHFYNHLQHEARAVADDGNTNTFFWRWGHQASWEHKKTLQVWLLNTNCLHQMQRVGKAKKKKTQKKTRGEQVLQKSGLDIRLESVCPADALAATKWACIPSATEKSNWTCPSNKTPSKSYVPPDLKQQQNTWS